MLLPSVPHLTLLLFLCGWTHSLRHVRLTVPEAVKSESRVTLNCDYDLEGSDLYSIKWYLGDEEFYRFVPKEEPPTRVFPISGIRVDIAESDAHSVTLLDVTRHLTGFYKCEVSADAPLFHTDIKSAYMTVVDVPREEPAIFIEKLRYSAGETIKANCTSRASYPAVNITWFINGKKVTPTNPVLVTPVYGGTMESSCSNLELEADSSKFINSRLRLWCTASLFDVYRQSSIYVDVQEDTPQIASVLGPSISDGSTTLQLSFWMLTVILLSFVWILHR